MTSACGRGPSGSGSLPSGRASRGFEEMWAIRWSAASSDGAPSRRGRRCPRGCVRGGAARAGCGRRSTSSEPSASGLVTSTAEPQRAEARRHRPQRGHDFAGDAVAQHDPLGEGVVEVGLVAVGGQVAGQRLDRRHLGAGAPGEDRGQPEVVHVLVADDEQLDVLDRVPAGVRAAARARPAPWPSSGPSRSASAASPRSGRRSRARP